MPGKSLIINFSGYSNQKCYLSADLLTELKAEVGSLATISFKSSVIACKLYPQFKPVDYIEADDVLWSGKDLGDRAYDEVNFPEDVTLYRTKTLEKVGVNVILKDLKTLIKHTDAEHLRNGVLSILQNFTVLPGFHLNCASHKVAELYGIRRIYILNIYIEGDLSGKISSSTVIEINGITSEDHMKQLSSFGEIKLGGLESVLSSLKRIFGNCDTLNTKILLTGPPGCGKSMLIKKLALVTNAYLITVCASNLIRKSSEALSKLYNSIKELHRLPSSFSCIVFLKELEFTYSNNQKNAKSLYLVLSLLDLISNCKNVVTFGSAPSSRMVHPELKRSGRFLKEIHIGVPTLEQRKDILQVLTQNMNLNVDIMEIARDTPGYVGSDLTLLCTVAESNAQQDKNGRPISDVDFKTALGIVKPSILKDSTFRLEVQPIHWDDIGGMESIKRRVTIGIEWPLLYPDAFVKVGLPSVHGVLLFGPPGCCKTTLVRVLATECKANFFSASPAQIYSPFVGDSEKSIIELFHQARLCAPSIVFLDEIDSIVGKRSYSSKHRGIQEKVLSALLNEMDGFGVHSESLQGVVTEGSLEEGSTITNNQNVIVVGATNRIDLIDDALLRPGRFDSVLYVPPPNLKEREAILETFTKKMALKNVNLKWLAEQTKLFSGADLQNLCRMAALSAIKSASNVTEEHFSSALKLTHPTITQDQLNNYEKLASKYSSVIT